MTWTELAKRLGIGRSYIYHSLLSRPGCPQTPDLDAWGDYVRGLNYKLKGADRAVMRFYKSERVVLRKFDERHHWGNISAVRRLCGVGGKPHKWSSQPVARDIRACANCGTEFACRPVETTKCCSRICAGVMARTVKPRACGRCGKDFLPSKPAAKYCSSRCANNAGPDDAVHKKIQQWLRLKIARQLKKQNAEKPTSLTAVLEPIVGCTVPQLLKHIESQFSARMSWKNHGTVWHLDHTIPLRCFDHRDMAQVRRAWNWQNLRPLLKRDNLRKGGRVTNAQEHLPLSIL